MLVVAASGKFIYSMADLVDSHALAAMKGVCGVAPRAAQIAARQTHENARQPSTSPFTLDRLENLGDEDGLRLDGSSISGDERSLHFYVPSTMRRRRTSPSLLTNDRSPERGPKNEKSGCIPRPPARREP